MPSTAAAPFALHPSLDSARLRRDFQAKGRARIAPFLTDDSAAALLTHLQARGDWRLVLNAGEKVYELDRAGQESLTAAERARLDRLVEVAARRGFQYRYESVRVPDEESERNGNATLLDRFALFFSSPAVIAFLEELTGCEDLAFADAQATRYSAGHFLTAHDDDVGGKNRRAAYVLGLTRSWRAEWGGLLMFHGHDGHIDRALVPSFNSLDIFAVPQPHSVSYVCPFAEGSRWSVTGWLRARPGS